MTEERWYSVEDIAIHLGISRDTLYKWISRKSKGIPAHKIGKLWKFKLEEVDDWVKSGQGANQGTSEAKSGKGK